jgi:hypothetical protein
MDWHREFSLRKTVRLMFIFGVLLALLAGVVFFVDRWWAGTLALFAIAIIYWSAVLDPGKN